MRSSELLRVGITVWIAIQLGGCSSIITTREHEKNQYDADNPNISYVGRFNNKDPKNVTYDWPGVQIYTKFEGTSCSLRLKDRANEYAVIIDYKDPMTLKMNSDTIYNVASGLPDSIIHTISIHKRTESFIGTGEFRGFILDPGKNLVHPDLRPDKRIEFIGNSITCGFGVEGKNSDCHFSPETENAYMSYASITARDLGADYSLVAYSGRGVVKNFGDKNQVSRDPMPELYDRICCNDSVNKWDFNKWIPQAVVINLGTNDYSAQPFPDKSVFQNAYINLIERVRSLYPGVTIFCVCGPMIEEPCFTFIKEIVDQEQAKTVIPSVYFIGIPKKIMSDADWGCDWHPNIQGMRKMADIIVPEIRLRMKWDLLN